MAASHVTPTERAYDRRRLLRISDAIVLYLVSCIAFIGLRERGGLWATIAILAVVVFGIWLTHVIRIEVREGRTPRRLAVLLVLLPLILGGALLWLWLRTDRSDGWGFFGVATFYIGVGLVISQIRHSRRWSRPLGIRFGLVTLAAVVIAVVALLLEQSWAPPLLVIGILAAPVAISLLSADFNFSLQRQRDPRNARTLAIAGALVVGASAVVLVLAIDLGASFTLTFAVLLFLAVLAVAARSNADVVLFVAAIAVVWATAPRTEPLPESVTAEAGEAVLAALGDSFTSGEGAPRYFEGTNNEGENECRRAPTAYPTQLADVPEAADDVIFIACSGARATHIHESPQHPGEPIEGPASAGTEATTEVVRGLPQLDNLQWQLEQAGLAPEDIELVLVGIAGNDAGFGDIARTCVLPGDCSELGQAWLDSLEREVRPVVSRAYEAIDEALPETPVLVVPYPVPIDPKKDCDYSAFDADEHEFLAAFTRRLDGVLREAAADSRFHFLDEMIDALDDHQLCDGDADDVGVNFLASNSVDGLLEQEVNPSHWFHNSMHPNPTGHRLMARTVGTWMRDNPDPSARTTVAPTPELDQSAGFGDECVGDPELEECAAAWSREQQGRFLLFPGSVVAVLAFGSWLLSLPLIRWWRRTAEPRLQSRLRPIWRSIRRALHLNT
jgi:GDSL-like Lipase/Acylhydrolase family